MNTLSDQKSTFVTVVAWIFIVLSAMTLAGVFMQAIMFAFVFDPEIKNEMFSEVPWLTFIWMAMCLCVVLALIASIGLLHRKNWARILFMIGRVCNLNCVILLN